MGGQDGGGTTDATEHPVARPGLDDHLALVTLCYLLAGVSATCVLSLLAFYAVELRTGTPHVFGPTSDLTTSLWSLLLVPLLLASSRVLRSRRGRLLIGLTAVLCLVGAAASLLLVVGVLPFGLSTPISVVAVLAQATWLLAVCRSLRRSGRRAPAAATLGRLMGLGLWAGALLVGTSLALGWGSMPQVVVMGAAWSPGRRPGSAGRSGSG